MKHVLIVATILISLISCKKEEVSEPQGLTHCEQVAQDYYEIRDANLLRIQQVEEDRDAGIIMQSHAEAKMDFIRDETRNAQSYWLSECPQN